MNINCFQQSIIFQNVNEIMNYKRRRIEFVPVRMKRRKIAQYLFSDHSSPEYAEMTITLLSLLLQIGPYSELKL